MRSYCCVCVSLSLLGNGSVEIPLSLLGNGYVRYGCTVQCTRNARATQYIQPPHHLQSSIYSDATHNPVRDSLLIYCILIIL
jgi:hypothetical protein